MRVFISHSSSNAKAAEDICGLIEKDGHKCFLAPRDIRSGYEYAEEIINGIDSAEVMLLLLSAEANSSPHVLREIERAVSRKIAIIVYKLEEVTLSKSMEYFLMTHQWINSKPGADYGEVVKCIDEFARKNDGENEDSESTAASAEKTAAPEAAVKKSGISKKTIAVIAVCAVILIAAGIGVGIFLSAKEPQTSLQDSGMQNTVTSEAVSDGGNSSVREIAASHEAGSSQGTASAQGTASQQMTEAPTEEAVPVQGTISSTEAAPPAEETAPAEATDTRETETTDTAALAELGDTILLGSYNGEPIEWRVLKLSEDGKTAVIMTDSIITMKAFDAAEGGKFNYADGEYYYSTSAADMTPELERQLRGDNRWEISNIRTWLNSDKENVTYSDQAPVASAMAEQKNGYNTEPGFLKSFAEEELSAVLTTEVETNGTVTSDKVFLLSREEYALLAEADIRKYAVPTEGAKAQDTSRWYELNVNDYGVTDHYWWLRDASADSASEVYLVNFSYAGEEIITASAALEGYGIRPAMTVDLTSSVISIKE